MVLARGNTPYEIVKGAYGGVLNIFTDWVQFCMLYSACELHPFLMSACKNPKARGPPRVLHFKKLRNGGHMDVRMDTNKSKGFL